MSGKVACGVAVIVTHEQRVLFGKRGSSATRFEWQLPGGWIVPGETPTQAARREVLEETGLCLAELTFVGLSNNLFSTGQHSISLYFEAECSNAGELALREASSCVGWEWKVWSEITDRLYLPLRLFKQTDYRPFLKDIRRRPVSI